MEGYAGSLWAARFASEHLEELRERFREDYLKTQMKRLTEDADSVYDMPLSDISADQTPAVITESDENIRKTGLQGISVIDEIYRIAHEEKRGYEVELRKIPIRQFTIELSEIAGIDPYHAESNAVLRTGEADRQSPGTCIGCTYPGLDVNLIR